MTGRRDLGTILATVGALFVGASSYIDWFADRTAIDTPLHRLYETSISPPADSWWRSVAVPLIVVVIIAVIGLILRSQAVFFVSWAVGAATLVLFVAMQYNDDAVDFAFADLQAGVWQSLIALGVMLFGIAVMGRPPRPEPVPEEPGVRDEETARRADEAAARADEAAGRAAEAAGRADAAVGRVDTDPSRTDTEPVGRDEPAEGRGGWWRRRGRRGEHAEPAETDRAEAERAEAERAEAERAEAERAEAERAEAERAEDTERR
jgi:hypothetical protein